MFYTLPPTSRLAAVYRAILPSKLRDRLYLARQAILRRFGLLTRPTPGIFARTIQVSEAAVFGRNNPYSSNREFPLNKDGVPTASETIIPAIDSRPQPGIPERMFVGDPPREQLYL